MKTWAPLAIGGLLLCSCGQRTASNPSAAPQATSPVSGHVLVDGKPAAKLQVTCHDTQATRTKNAPRPTGLTGDDGTIEFSTYQKGDGVRPGDYVLTFTWREWDPDWSRFSGADRLKDRYADAHKSAIRLTVKQGEPTALGVIELSTE
jgi:5-hydroxyisourate hydrolase-like protein (transthyretin family)